MKLKKIIIAILLIFFIGGICFIFSSEEEAREDVKIIGGFYDSAVNEKVVPGDAICYSEYYYNTNISKDISSTYLSVDSENIAEVRKYMERFEDRFLYSTDKGKKDFTENLDEGDYYFLDSGCSSELSENHFKLYYYDSEAYTLYYMWRCQ
ncbi:MAG: hypothetical protein IJB74_03765 [Clostridia bacterium]|nr:hypothetical protein [Clostridia bacterium]